MGGQEGGAAERKGRGGGEGQRVAPASLLPSPSLPRPQASYAYTVAMIQAAREEAKGAHHVPPAAVKPFSRR